MSQANLSQANLHDADLEGANLRGADLRGADLSEADLYQADLRDANLRGAILDQADLRQAQLDGAKLDEEALGQAYLKNEELPPDYDDDNEQHDEQEQDDEQEQYDKEELLERLAAARKADERANLRGVDLSKADLPRIDLEAADLCEANLSQANLSQANLHDADLEGANLRGADLREADLSEADLYQADLRDADLRGAILREADLRQAKLDGANLSGVDLSQAYLKNEDLPPDYYDDDEDEDEEDDEQQHEKDEVFEAAQILPTGVRLENEEARLMPVLSQVMFMTGFTFLGLLATVIWQSSIVIFFGIIAYFLLRFLYPRRGLILGSWWWGNQTKVELATAPLDLGQDVQLYVESQTTRPMAVDHLLIQLIGRFESEVQVPENLPQLREDIFYEQEVIGHKDFVIEAGVPWQQQLEMLIPDDAEPNVNKKKAWAIRVIIQPRQSAQITATFPIPVKHSETEKALEERASSPDAFLEGDDESPTEAHQVEQLPIAEKDEVDEVDQAYQSGQLAYKEERLDEAIVAFERVIELEPSHVKAHNYLGTVYYLNGRPNEAIKTLQRALQLDPKHSHSYLNLGLVYKETGNATLALRMFHRYLELAPPDNKSAVYVQELIEELSES